MYRLRLLLFVTLVLSGVRGDYKRKVSEEEYIDSVAKAREFNKEINAAVRQEGIPPSDVEPEEVPTPAALAGGSGNHGDLGAEASLSQIWFIAVVVGCSVAGLVGLVLAGFCWFKLQKNVRDASEVDYPAYGITSKETPPLGSPGDRKLAQSAQMYHYQHQKQQMIAMEKSNNDMKPDGSDEDSEEENEEGDYTVYECPGLAPSGEMEVKNPLFSEETPQTPAPPSIPGSEQ